VLGARGGGKAAGEHGGAAAGLYRVRAAAGGNRGGKLMARKGLSKRLRFEVFKRDSFKCQYCGRCAPDVVLNIDHIKAVADGGADHPANLVTACKGCNGGKSDVPLDTTMIEELTAQMLKNGTLNERRRRKPAMLFPHDLLLTDPHIRASSLTARGVWFEFLCHSHLEGDPIFCLQGGAGFSHAQIASAIAMTEQEITLSIDGLVSLGIVSLNAKGAILCRPFAESLGIVFEGGANDGQSKGLVLGS
jgi:hypothetical protein